VYDYYISCLEERAEEGISLLGEQGGRIDVGEFFPGSAYMPFSSHLDFMGQGVPYWMYVSGNNLLKENVPSKAEMESELEDYVGKRVGLCDFSYFEEQGFDVFVGEDAEVEVKINSRDVEVEVKNRVSIFKGEVSGVVSSHDLEVKSKLGKFYEMALDVYDHERENMFLEGYAVDVLRLYAPVDGVEEGCEPKIFVQEEIAEELKDGLSANINSIRLDGDYYDLASKEREYFVEDGVDVDENVNFMYMKDWPTRVEIYGDMIVKPVGLQQGLGILGFCYTPYHLVYDINFPVMVQFFDDDELFQFPVGVVIDKNQPRNALPSVSGRSIESEVCQYRNQEVEVYTYDVELNPVEAQVSFKCLDSVCHIGKTVSDGGDAVLVDDFPQCVNGFVVANAEGYAEAKYQISTNEERIANVVLKKEYEVGLDLGNVNRAVVNFVSKDYSATVVYPDSESIKLVEGYYNVSVYVYSDSGLKIPASSRQECVDVPESGLMGMFGAETEKCYDIDLPEIDIDYAVVGGGKTVEYVTSEDLARSSEINLNVPLFGTPGSIEDLAANAELVEDSIVEVWYE